jgi:hypothetical protein
MKKIIILFAISLLLTACGPDVDIIVAAVAETQAAIPTSTQDTTYADRYEDRYQAEIQQLQVDLSNASVELTLAAEQIATLESLVRVQTEVQVVTVTPGPTEIPPTATTAVREIPENQMLVYAIGQVPLWKVSDTNKKDLPIMVKTAPIIRYYNDDWIIVYKAVVKADGGATFYRVISPYGGGYYVRTQDVSTNK